MEEILASIKRVIAEDGRVAAAAPRGTRGGSRPARPVSVEEDVLELSDPVSEDDALMSENSTEASRQSLAALAALSQAAETPVSSHPGDGPLEAVVRDMLRPMLKDWLDQHLPEMVEDMVAREIARITGKSL